jgi:DMSO/TMAO reductase YedYZ molybdopterin-dependent catalytic subunit
MPGFVFGFLIDTLQHAGKVVEEVGLAVAMIVALGLLGATWALAERRRPFPHSALVFAGIGWLVVVLVLLPITGEGPLGLNQGFTTPIVWAVLFVAYGMVLELSAAPSANESVDLQRRSVLGALPLGIGVAALGLTGLLRVPEWFQAVANAPGSGLTGPSPAITPVSDFYVVSKNFSDPNVDAGSWSLKVAGLVDNPLTLSLDDLHARPGSTEYVTLECISNNVGGPQMSTGKFVGLRLAALVSEAKPRAGASWVGFHAVDGYTESLPLSMVQGEQDILVAHTLNDAPLPASHGFPARILIPGHYGMKGPKWLDTITLDSSETRGYWEQQGWDHDAIVRTTSRFDVPADGAILKLGNVQLAGVAFAGTRGIAKVEFSTDGGRSWSEANLQPPLSAYTWVLWTATWATSSEGSYQLQVRATDGTGALQSTSQAMSFPSGSSGYHTIQIEIGK